ncbi:hypothetical protein EDD21DRAFT_189344 [Dissophora ornata]|nr:hypothetical protein EDD21DRAFT_189344 [Dissophora ornata]
MRSASIGIALAFSTLAILFTTTINAEAAPLNRRGVNSSRFKMCYDPCMQNAKESYKNCVNSSHYEGLCQSSQAKMNQQCSIKCQ